jgi:hypothetical protein
MNVPADTALTAINLTSTRYHKQIDHNQRERDRPSVFANGLHEITERTVTVSTRENLT